MKARDRSGWEREWMQCQRTAETDVFGIR